jgi:hypothetical protein
MAVEQYRNDNWKGTSKCLEIILLKYRFFHHKPWTEVRCRQPELLLKTTGATVGTVRNSVINLSPFDLLLSAVPSARFYNLWAINSKNLLVEIDSNYFRMSPVL